MPNFTNIQGGESGGMTVSSRKKTACFSVKAAATQTLTLDHPPIIYFDVDTADQKVILPDPTTARFFEFIIVNTDATLNVLVRNFGDTALVTLAALTAGRFHCDGIAWRRIA
jgi:hypothetical protein